MPSDLYNISIPSTHSIWRHTYGGDGDRIVRQVWGCCKWWLHFSLFFYRSNAVCKNKGEVLREISRDDMGRYHRWHTYLRRGYAPTILGDAWFAAKARPYDHALRR